MKMSVGNPLSTKSYLTEVRGLKLIGVLILLPGHVVPHRGTWIEMQNFWRKTEMTESYLTEVRGLKYVRTNRRARPGGSYLTEVRGLKYPTGVEHEVAPCRTSQRYVD